MARGSPFKRATRLQGAHIMDLTPTLLHLMGVDLPDSLDGKVLEDALEPGFLEEHPIRLAATSRARPLVPDRAVSAAEMNELRKNLRGLGYFK